MNEVIQAISTVGFPIACCCFLLWQNSRQDEYHREQMEKLRETIKGNTDSITELGKLVQKLADLLQRKKNDDSEV
jgi:hypothetical protein